MPLLMASFIEDLMNKNLFSLILITLSISSCAWMSSSKGSSQTKTSIPKTPPMQKPGGTASNWRYMGTTDDGTLIDEINVNSITSGSSSQNIQIFNFEDRKTVVIPNKFAYPNNQPHFKYLISAWQMNCITQEYLMRKTTLYNDIGTKMTQYDYTNDNNVKWMKLGSGSFAQMQYNFICLNINRNLGY
jgi:hypothetical protein